MLSPGIKEGKSAKGEQTDLYDRVNTGVGVAYAGILPAVILLLAVSLLVIESRQYTWNRQTCCLVVEKVYQGTVDELCHADGDDDPIKHS